MLQKIYSACDWRLEGRGVLIGETQKRRMLRSLRCPSVVRYDREDVSSLCLRIASLEEALLMRRVMTATESTTARARHLLREAYSGESWSGFLISNQTVLP